MIKLINRYIRPYRLQLVWVLFFQILATIASLSLPTWNARIIDQGVAKGDTDAIMHFGLIMLGFSLLQGLCQISAVIFAGQAAMGFSRDLRQALLQKILGFSTKEVSHFGAPSLLTRSTNDVQQVQTLIFMTCAMMISAPITMIGGVVMALREDLVLSWLVLVAVMVLGSFTSMLVFKLTPLFQQNQYKIDTLNQVAREQISGIRVIRAFVREKLESDRFDKANHDLMSLAMRIATFFSMLMPFVFLVMDLGSVSVTWFGAHRIADGGIEVGQLTAFITYLMQILMSVMMATMMVMMAPRAAVCARRIQEVLHTESSVPAPEHAIEPASNAGEIVFDKVSFAYPGADRPVLDQLSFTLKPGTTTAIIGSTGAGKTTLLNLICRLFDVTEGQLLVDGVDVRDYEPEMLWAKIGLVPQKPYLFTGTIESNLAYGKPDASKDEAWQALRVAQAADFVQALPEGLAAPVAQGGTNFSGGQKQRLSIARALVKGAPIYLFDDAFSALDVTTDAKLRAALPQLTRGATVLIVGQRISTIKSADQIIVLETGQVVGIGTHAELLASCPTYQEIVESQHNASEAA